MSDYHPAFCVLKVEPYVSPESVATICWTTLCHATQRNVNHHCIQCIVCVIDRSCLLHFASSVHLLVHVFLEIRNFSAVLSPGNVPTTCSTGGWVGPMAGLEGCGKSHPLPGFNPRTVQPVVPTSYQRTHISCCILNWEQSEM